MSIAVLKLGGSLLDLPDLSVRVQTVFNKLGSDRPLLVCGGGAAADIVRGWDERFRLNEERAHWLALEAIRLNQRLLLDLLPKLELVASRAAAESAWRHDRVPLLDLAAFVSIEEASLDVHERLPHTWDVTSDSLAAWVALRWPASQLVLLKSIDWPFDEQVVSHRLMAERGLVDAYFPTIARNLPMIRWCHLRTSNALTILQFER